MRAQEVRYNRAAGKVLAVASSACQASSCKMLVPDQLPNHRTAAPVSGLCTPPLRLCAVKALYRCMPATSLLLPDNLRCPHSTSRTRRQSLSSNPAWICRDDISLILHCRLQGASSCEDRATADLPPLAEKAFDGALLSPVRLSLHCEPACLCCCTSQAQAMGTTTAHLSMPRMVCSASSVQALGASRAPTLQQSAAPLHCNV